MFVFTLDLYTDTEHRSRKYGIYSTFSQRLWKVLFDRFVGYRQGLMLSSLFISFQPAIARSKDVNICMRPSCIQGGVRNDLSLATASTIVRSFTAVELMIQAFSIESFAGCSIILSEDRCRRFTAGFIC